MPQAFEFPVFKIGIALISSTFYGGFLVLFIILLLIFRQQHRGKLAAQVSSTNAYLIFSYAMLVVLTTVWVLSAVMCFNPKLTEIEGVGGYSPLMFAQHIVGYLANGTGDAVMVYRLYVISGHGRVVFCTAVFLALCGFGLTSAVVFDFVLHHQFLQPANVILAGISIGVNVVATSLIAWNVWKRQALSRVVGGSKVINVGGQLLVVLVESCAFYTFWMIMFLITHFADNPLSQVFLYGSPHIAGIASMLVNVRVGLGWAMGGEECTTRSLNDSAFDDSRLSHGFLPTVS